MRTVRGAIRRAVKGLGRHIRGHHSSIRGEGRTTKTVILHIGYPKTGTSSLQWFFHTRRDDLRAQDVYYPRAGQVEGEHSHSKLAFALAENAYQAVNGRERKTLFEDLAAEIDQCRCGTVLLSSELFLSRLELIRDSDEFKQLFEGRQLRVLCVLRSQETFLESLYRQFIIDPTVGFTGPPEAFLDAYATVGDYHAGLTGWADFAGRENLVPLIYEQALHERGLIPSFCRLLGIDTSHLATEDVEVWRNVANDAFAIDGMDSSPEAAPMCQRLFRPRRPGIRGGAK